MAEFQKMIDADSLIIIFWDTLWSANVNPVIAT